jgi:CelD/BcsL family acetyltransferase involved in cellulose biosynthesis
MRTLRTIVAPDATALLDTDGWSAEIRRDDACLATLRAEWDDLYRRCAAATTFQSHAWLESWWRHYGTTGRLRVVLVRHSGRLVAAAALTLRRRGLFAVLEPLGGALSDFTDVLIDDAVAVPAARAMATTLFRNRGWQVIDFPETRPGATAGRALRAAWPGRSWQIPASVCLELPATSTEDLVHDLPGHTRKTIKRRINQIARLGVDVQPVSADDSERAVAELLRLHAAQWAGRGVNPEHLRPRFAGHLTDSVRGMIAEGQAALLEYRVDGELVASNLVLVGADVAGGYLYGADPELRNRLDIATMLVTTTLPVAYRRGCTTMSMLRGAESYKTRWRPREATNQRLLLARPRTGPVVYAGLVRGWRRCRALARQNAPWLRHARDAARRFAARLKPGRP